MSRRRLPFALALLPMLALAACGAPDPGMKPVVTAPDAAPEDVAVGGQPATDLSQTSAVRGTVDRPQRLTGLKALEVRAVLGVPAFKRRDKPAEIWQYRLPACTLDLFLYDENGNQTVAYYAVRSTSGVGDKDCFDQIVARGRNIPTS